MEKEYKIVIAVAVGIVAAIVAFAFVAPAVAEFIAVAVFVGVPAVSAYYLLAGEL